MSSIVEADGTAGCHVSFGRVVHAEWTKLRSLPSNWIALGTVALLTTGFAGAIGYASNRNRDSAMSVGEAAGGALLGVDLVSLVIGVVGILLVTAEYGSGLIRATLAAVPRRLPVLWAKALVLFSVTAPLMLVVCFASFLLNQAFVDAGWRVGLGDQGVLRAIVGAAAASVAFGLLGLAVGTMLRHTAAAITIFVVALLVLPALLPAAMSASVRDDVLPYVPVAAGQALYALDDSNPFRLLSPGAAALVLAGWVVLALAGGAVVLSRRDA